MPKRARNPTAPTTHFAPTRSELRAYLEEAGPEAYAELITAFCDIRKADKTSSPLNPLYVPLPAGRTDCLSWEEDSEEPDLDKMLARCVERQVASHAVQKRVQEACEVQFRCRDRSKHGEYGPFPDLLGRSPKIEIPAPSKMIHQALREAWNSNNAGDAGRFWKAAYRRAGAFGRFWRWIQTRRADGGAAGKKPKGAAKDASKKDAGVLVSE